MCGICGTYISNKVNKTSLINLTLLQKNTNDFLISPNDKLAKRIEKKIINYKSDINFLKYFHNLDDRKKIKQIIKNLKLIEKKNLKSYNTLIKDLIFNLDIELKNRYKFVNNNSVKKFLINDKYIIFLKVLFNSINSINYLEMRGRDSLGACFQIRVKKKFIDFEKLKINKLKNCQYSFEKNYYTFTFNFKTFSLVGMLRQNSEILLKIILDNKDFINLINLNFESISIFFHTRWASVGKINNENTHPINNISLLKEKIKKSFSSVNGDIYNFKELVKSERKKNKNLNSLTTSDSLALSYFVGNIDNKDSYKKILKKINKLQGSYVSSSVSDKFSGKILIIKNGQQGLYIGKSIDRYFFASDVYALVEESTSYYKVESNSFFFLPINTKKKFNYFDINLNNKFTIDKFINININLRDIYLNNYSHYFAKEISETSSIINKTNLKYNHKNNFFFNKSSYLKKIKKSLYDGKINKIIITGMGSCYTASVAIAHYMRIIFEKYIDINITIQPHIASEASGFYTNLNMKDHLVIILGQSGTTVDTNTYAKIAKNRGASTISFLNKRQGDLSYLVDYNLYIGDGRDVEISVPSTKTYLAHINLGYLFTSFLIDKKKYPKLSLDQFNKIQNLPLQINKNLSKIKEINFDNITNIFCKKPNWYIIYDDSELSVTNLEIKIKFSELCYKSIPTFDIKYFLNLKIKDSIIIFNTSANYIALQNNINEILDYNNTIFLVSNDKRFSLIKKLNLHFFYQEKLSDNFNIYNSIIFFQIFSYELAKKLNMRSKFILNLINSNNALEIKDSLNNILKNISLGLYNLEDNKKLLLNICKKIIYNNYKLNLLDIIELNKLSNLLMRPIDTVKHQAKTITVGATRDTDTKDYKLKFINKDFKKINNENLIKNYYLYSNYIHESYIYDLVNRLNFLDKNKQYSFNLARQYDLNKISSKKLNYINLNDYVQNINSPILNINDTEKLYKNISNLFFPKNKIKKINNFSLSKSINTTFTILNNKIKKAKNIKFLASGVNYNIAKLFSLLFTKIYNKPFSFDVLENHKHIDVSAEPLLILLMGNINNKIYQKDAISEIIKFISHNNECVIFFDKTQNDYKKLRKDVTLFEHSSTHELYSFIYYKMLFNKIFKFSLY